eukprot:gene22959-30144_t
MAPDGLWVTDIQGPHSGRNPPAPSTAHTPARGVTDIQGPQSGRHPPAPSTPYIPARGVTDINVHGSVFNPAEPSTSPPTSAQTSLRRELSQWIHHPGVAAAFVAKGVKSLYPWQAGALECGEDGSNLVYCAPTSGGKSLVAEILMIRRMHAWKTATQHHIRQQAARGRGGRPVQRPPIRALMVLPFVSIVNEKTVHLSQVLAPMGCSVKGYGGTESGCALSKKVGPASNGVGYHHAGLFGAERNCVEAGFRSGAILVLTATTTLAAGVNLPARRVILRGLWQGAGPVSRSTYLQMIGRAGRAGQSAVGESFIIGKGPPHAARGDWPQEVADAAAEEVDAATAHMVSDPKRGLPLELCLSKIMHAATPGNPGGPRPQIICMSATMRGLDSMCSWLDARLFMTNFRPVLLTEFAVFAGKVYQKRSISEMSAATTEAARKKKAAAKSAISEVGFVNAKNAKVKKGNMDKVEPFIELRELPESCSSRDKDGLVHLVANGVGYHHAGLFGAERNCVEAGFRSGAILVLTATTTLAAGVNLPARRVILRGLWQGAGPVSRSTYLQMIGRAGRAGQSAVGESFIIGKGPPHAARGDWPQEVADAAAEEVDAATNTRVTAGGPLYWHTAEVPGASK